MRFGTRLLQLMALLWLTASVQAQGAATADDTRSERAEVARAAQEAMLKCY